MLYEQVVYQPFPKQQILDSSNLEHFADDNVKFDENGKKLFKRVKKNCRKRRNCSSRAISPFPTVFSRLLQQTSKNKGLFGQKLIMSKCFAICKVSLCQRIILSPYLVRFVIYPFPKRQILDSSKLKDFADDNFKFDNNGRNYIKRVENTVGKGEILHYEQFLLFRQCF